MYAMFVRVPMEARIKLQIPWNWSYKPPDMGLKLELGSSEEQ